MGSWAFSFGPHASNPVPFDKTAKRLAAAGFDGIEICGFPPHVTIEQYATKRSRAELCEFLGDLGLGISGYISDLTRVNPIPVSHRQKYLDLFQRNLELAADIHAPAMRVDTGAAPGSIADNEYDAAFHRIADIWKEAAELAARAGVRLLWEFEPGFVFNKPSEVAHLHELVGHSNLFVLFDTAHAYMCGVVGSRQHPPREVLGGGVSEFLELLRGRIGHVHIIDSDGTLYGDETSTHRPFGQGRIDFKKIAPKLLAIPGIEWWCVDLCFWPGSWELVEPSREYVAGLLGAQERANPDQPPPSKRSG